MLARCRMASRTGSQWRSSQPRVVRTGSYAPNRHDTGSTTARSVDEVALIRDTVSHCAPVLIAQNSSRRRPWAGPIFFAASVSTALDTLQRRMLGLEAPPTLLAPRRRG